LDLYLYAKGSSVMGSMSKITRTKATPEQMAFEMFADVYPHEAAEVDWLAFVAYTQSKNPAIPEEEIRRLLERTKEQ
jgi:hypothetical protein